MILRHRDDERDPDEKVNQNPLPGIAHDFHCTHEAVLCRCWAAELVAVRAERERLREALVEVRELARVMNVNPDMPVASFADSLFVICLPALAASPTGPQT